MPDARTCPACGHTAGPDDRFCPRCGAAVPGASTLAPEPVAPGTPPTGERATSSALAPPDPALEEHLREALSPGFLLVRRLGAGGMASVWLAREPALRRLVAVKLLATDLAASPSARARFEREAQAVAGLVHPNVVGIHGLGALADGTPYFVMQHVGGKSLAARLEEEGPLDPDEARRITGEIAGALAAAHAKGIVHRDIKPANILYDDETGRALVSDFGIAAVLSTSAGGHETRLTQTGMIVGTPQYMSPETLSGEAASDRTDVYALGLVAYELVAGHGPFEATTPQTLIAAHLRDVPPPLSTVRADVDPEFERLVAACLAKEPARRPAAADLAKRLAPGGGLAIEWPPPGLDRLRGSLRRWSAGLWAGDLLMAVAALGFVTFGTRLETVNQSLGALLLALAAVAGTAILALGFAGLSGPLRRGTTAVRLGYGWITVLETLSDTRGDTGALIAGAREYASLEPRVRSALRLARVVREALVFASAFAPLPLLMLLVRLGNAGAVSAGATPWFLLGPSALALLVAIGLGELEQRSVLTSRAALDRRRQRVDFAKLVEPWYVSFESVRAGQDLGRGPTRLARLAHEAGLALAALGVAALVVLGPLWGLASFGPVLWRTNGPKIETMRLKLGIASRMRRFALPPDTTITPLEAGEAMLVLSRTAEPVASDLRFVADTNGTAPRLRPVPRTVPDLPQYDQHLFPPSMAWHGPDPMAIVELSAHGFSPAQLRYLAQLTAHPAWREFRTVARARTMDRAGAAFVLPFSDSVTSGAVFAGLGPSLAGTKVMAYANASRAAYYLAIGQPAKAEEALREGVSFGFQLVDHGSTLIDVLIGVVIEGITRYEMMQFYTATRRPEGVFLQAFTDSLRNAPDAFGLGDAAAATRPAPSRGQWLAALRDTTLPMPMRREMLNAAQIAVCTNLRELLFGPAPDIDSAFATARRSLVRLPSDRALIDVYERTARRRLAPGVGQGVGPEIGEVRQFLIDAAWWLGRLSGNRRVGGCAELALAATAPHQ